MQTLYLNHLSLSLSFLFIFINSLFISLPLYSSPYFSFHHTHLIHSHHQYSSPPPPFIHNLIFSHILLQYLHLHSSSLFLNILILLPHIQHQPSFQLSRLILIFFIPFLSPHSPSSLHSNHTSNLILFSNSPSFHHYLIPSKPSKSPLPSFLFLVLPHPSHSFNSSQPSLLILIFLFSLFIHLHSLNQHTYSSSLLPFNPYSLSNPYTLNSFPPPLFPFLFLSSPFNFHTSFPLSDYIKPFILIFFINPFLSLLSLNLSTYSSSILLSIYSFHNLFLPSHHFSQSTLPSSLSTFSIHHHLPYSSLSIHSYYFLQSSSSPSSSSFTFIVPFHLNQNYIYSFIYLSILSLKLLHSTYLNHIIYFPFPIPIHIFNPFPPQ